MGAIWTLAKGADERSLSAWGITGRAQLTFNSARTDEFQFDVRPTDALAAPIFAIDDALILKKDGVNWFAGTVRQIRTSGDASSEKHSFTVRNFWDKLERLVYDQVHNIANAGFTAVTQVTASTVYLCQDINASTGVASKVDAGTFIDRVVTFAQAAGISFTLTRSFDAPTPPSESGRDMSCAAVIRRLLAWSPDVVTWVDYTASPPVLHMDDRAGLTAVNVNLVSDALESFDITPRNDLVPAGIAVNFVTTEVNDNISYTRIDKQTAGTASGIGVIEATIDAPLSQDGTYEGVPTGPAGSGQTFAQYLYAALATVFFEGSVSFHAEDCPGTIRPGKKLNFTGTSRADFTTAAALVQSVREDLFYGKTEVSFGPPDHLTLGDLLRLYQNRFKQMRNNPVIPNSRPPNTTGAVVGGGPCVYLDLCSGENNVRVQLCQS